MWERVVINDGIGVSQLLGERARVSPQSLRL